LWAVQPPSAAARGQLADVLGIATLLRVVGVVAHDEVPADGVVLGRQAVERRHVVVVGHRVRRRLERVAAARSARVAAGLEDEHAIAAFGQARRDGPAAGAGADDDVVRWRVGSGGAAREAGQADAGERGLDELAAVK
jgi:hypothetical protein